MHCTGLGVTVSRQSTGSGSAPSALKWLPSVIGLWEGAGRVAYGRAQIWFKLFCLTSWVFYGHCIRNVMLIYTFTESYRYVPFRIDKGLFF